MRLPLFVFLAIGFASSISLYAEVDDANLNALRQATRRAADTSFNLAYDMSAGDQLTYEVEHLVKVATEIQGTTQRTQSRTESAKVWKVSEVADVTGYITFSHEIAYVDMWNEVDGRDATRYDSRSREEPSAEFAQVAKSIGKPIATVTVDRTGRVVQRDGQQGGHDLGTGGLLVPLPEGPAELGSEWSVPKALSVRLGDGTFKTVKTRQVYRLERVDAGVATIATETQVLTPGIDPRMESQLMQKMTRGTIKFDIDAGCVISRQLDWDEEVVGFNGPESNMTYLARLTETLKSDPKVARRP